MGLCQILASKLVYKHWHLLEQGYTKPLIPFSYFLHLVREISINLQFLRVKQRLSLSWDTFVLGIWVTFCCLSVTVISGLSDLKALPNNVRVFVWFSSGLSLCAMVKCVKCNRNSQLQITPSVGSGAARDLRSRNTNNRQVLSSRIVYLVGLNRMAKLILSFHTAYEKEKTMKIYVNKNL